MEVRQRSSSTNPLKRGRSTFWDSSRRPKKTGPEYNRDLMVRTPEDMNGVANVRTEEATSFGSRLGFSAAVVPTSQKSSDSSVPISNFIR